MYWSSIKETNDGWFYKTAEDWEKETFLSRREQETVRRNLMKKKVLEEVKKGIPAKLYFRVNNSELLDAIQKIVQTRMAENAKQASTNPPNSDGGKGETNTESTSENTSETKSILFDAEFEEFWAAYPKRPNNPRKKAMAAYKKARKTTSQEKLLTSVGEYFAYMQGENPKFVAMASTWLNDERWNCDYSESAEVIKAYKSTKAGDASTVSNEDLDAVINQYKGIVSDRMAAKRILAAEFSSGITLDRIVEAAEKYAMHCKQMRYDGIKINTPILEAWLKFKWREMDAYFISKSPMRKPILKPVSEKRK
jgi:tRNA(Ser,Leu) C12 N-acetylase TAN1